MDRLPMPRRLGRWEVTATEPLCTLNAGRFRLPLINGVRRLSTRYESGVLLLDSPGVVRGMAGSELLHGLVEAANIDLILAMSAPDGEPPLAGELGAIPADCCLIEPAAAARRPDRRARGRSRTAQWDGYLSDAVERRLDLDGLALVGAPPPLDATEVWVGRQIALLSRGDCLAMGEVARLTARRLDVRLPIAVGDCDTLMVRDAVRSARGMLESAAPFVTAAVMYAPQCGPLSDRGADHGPRPVARVGGAGAQLLHHLGIGALGHEADVLAVRLVGDREAEVRVGALKVARKLLGRDPELSDRAEEVFRAALEDADLAVAAVVLDDQHVLEQDETDLEGACLVGHVAGGQPAPGAAHADVEQRRARRGRGLRGG